MAERDVSDELLLIDLSSIAHPIFVMSASEPDPNAASTKIVDRVRAMATQHPHAAICCDSGKSFRHDLDATYKANRPERDAAMHHQIALAREQLAADGFPVWMVKGYEADDLIATATAKALAIEGTRVLIATSDKDLLQLVGLRVNAKSMRGDGAIIDEKAVKAKFGIDPGQMRDYLSLVGDASDNIKGAKGIGEKRAVDILMLFGTLDACYEAIDKNEAKLPTAILNSLIEFRERKDAVRKLITLCADVEIPFEEIAAERTPTDVAPLDADEEAVDNIPQPTAERSGQDGTVSVDAAKGRVSDPRGNATAADVGSASPQTSHVVMAAHLAGTNGNGHHNGNGNGNGNGAGTALVVREPDVLAPPPSEWGKQLEPRSMREAQNLATAMFQAKLFNGYGSAPAVLSTIMAGRELGLQAVASLRGFHIVEGRHMLAADLIRGLVLKSGLADFFKCTERSATQATFSTHRKDDPDKTPTVLTYTLSEGRVAFGIVPGITDKDLATKEAAWTRSGWGRNPADMLVARAGAKLARLVYPEVSFGLYAPEELENG